jgi:tRNA/tmRNA/rRNA uracil-C5-methylase (TrmA/RlmC/RlmD family)
MVAGALPGEHVLATPIGRRAGVVEAVTTEVLDDLHPAREREPCPHAMGCGGCDWPHVLAAEGAVLKRTIAAETARAHADLAALVAAAPIASSPLAYRIRARLHWDPVSARLGFYQPRSWRVSSITNCRIVSPKLVRALPHLVVALGRRCPERVDLEWLEGSDPREAVAALRPARGGPAAVEPSWVPSETETGADVIGFHVLTKGGVARAVWGAEEVTMRLPVPLRVPIGAFFQGNRHLLEPLFKRVSELVGPSPDPVYDLHAGVGFLAAAARAAGAAELTLVEPHRPAARAARRNLQGARVAVGRTAEEFLANAGSLPHTALAMTDPPRTGMTPTLRRRIAGWRPNRILMLGCDPATWARDAASLCDIGYRPRVVELFDLFPSTHHVEILALLESG